MKKKGNQSFDNLELVAVFIFSLSLLMVLLTATAYIGYDLFWEQLGAAIVFYLTILAAISSIARKGVPLIRFFQIFFVFLLVVFPYTAYTKADDTPLILDDFETGIGGWYRINAEGINSIINEQARLSPQGSWHMTWTVGNSCLDAPEHWALIDNCPPVTFSLKDYRSINFWYRTEVGEFGFLLLIRCPDYQNEYRWTLDASQKWKHVSLTLPRENDLAGWTVTGQPNTEEGHIAFSNDCNDTYHFDDIQLAKPMFMEQIGLLPTVGMEVGLFFGAFLLEFSSRKYTQFRKSVRV